MKGRRRVIVIVAAAVVIALAVHTALPAAAGFERSLELVREAELGWIAVGLLVSAVSLLCYVAVFHHTVGPPGAPHPALSRRESYEVTMASQAASTLITAAGAGAIALQVWALDRAGFGAQQAWRRVIAFLVFHYTIYLAVVAICGLLLWLGVFGGPAPALLTILPGLVATVLLALAGLAARRPDRFERRLRRVGRGSGRLARLAGRLATVPATLASGLGYSVELLRAPRGLRIVAYATGYWAFNIAVLGVAFLAFGESPKVPQLVMAYYVGMTINLLPLLPGGIGSVDAGLIGTLIAFGEPGAETVLAVLLYRLLSFWIPTVPEIAAYFQLRGTMAGWSTDPPAGRVELAEEPTSA